MKEYIAKGTLTLSEVTFYIRAKSRDDAWVRLAAGGFDYYDVDSAEAVDSHVILTSLEEN